MILRSRAGSHLKQDNSARDNKSVVHIKHQMVRPYAGRRMDHITVAVFVRITESASLHRNILTNKSFMATSAGGHFHLLFKDRATCLRHLVAPKMDAKLI